MRRRCLAFYLLLSLIAASPAFAGAWTQGAGDLMLITTASTYTTNHYWDNQGTKQTESTYHEYTLNPYLEYGLQDDLTIGANLSLQALHQQAGGTTNASDWGVGDSEFFLRKRFINASGFVASLEPMVKLPSRESTSLQSRIGSSNYDAGIGIATGYGFDAYHLHHFIDVDTQYRHRFGTPHDQIKLTGTLGISLTPKWMIMPQTFLTYHTASQPNAAFIQNSSNDYNLVRLQLSAVYAVTDKTSVQFGGFTDVAGENTGIGKGVLVSLWTKL